MGKRQKQPSSPKVAPEEESAGSSEIGQTSCLSFLFCANARELEREKEYKAKRARAAQAKREAEERQKKKDRGKVQLSEDQTILKQMQRVDRAKNRAKEKEKRRAKKGLASAGRSITLGESEMATVISKHS